MGVLGSWVSADVWDFSAKPDINDRSRCKLVLALAGSSEVRTVAGEVTAGVFTGGIFFLCYRCFILFLFALQFTYVLSGVTSSARRIKSLSEKVECCIE